MRNSLDLFREDMWTPFRHFTSLQDRFFNDFTEHDSQAGWSFNPACDVDESEDHFLVTLDMPGVSKNDIKIEVKDNTLVVSGEKNNEMAQGKGARHLTERYYGKFERRFSLPKSVMSEKIEASYNDGVLRIAIPKAEEVKPRQIKIGEGSSGLLDRLIGRKELKEKEASPTRN